MFVVCLFSGVLFKMSPPASLRLELHAVGFICILTPALNERGICEISCSTVTLDS